MTIQDEQPLRVNVDGHVAELTINRPSNLNALNPDMLQSIILAFADLGKNENVRVVTITGAGPKAFVAGADIGAMSQLGPRAIADYVELGQRATRTIETFPTPVIAVVNGFALGGGMELALSCDLIIAADTAKLGQPEVNLGIMTGFGGTQRLIQRAGVGAARKLCYSAELISASDALALGVIDRVVASEALTAEAKAWAKVIATKAPLAVRETKRVIRESQESSLLAGLRIEVEAFLKLFSTRDREEGMDAFLSKRNANFTGR